MSIREQAAGEQSVYLELRNAIAPPEMATTLEELKSYEQLGKPGSQPLRLLALIDDRPVAYASATQMVWDQDDRFGLAVGVHPEYRGRGIGRALYQRVLEHVRRQGARSVSTSVHEPQLHLSEQWLAREGFRETERLRPSEQSLAQLDEAAYSDVQERTRAAGIELDTLAAIDAEGTRQKLWTLYNLAERDVPSGEEHVDEPFERFSSQLDGPNFLKDCTVIARFGAEFVGFTLLVRSSSERAHIWMTGVHPQWRKHGVATAMKVRSALLARERGFASIRTFNHVNNPAMLAVNTRLGYRALPVSIIFVKTLDA